MITKNGKTYTFKPSKKGAVTGALAGMRAGSVIPHVGSTAGGITWSYLWRSRLRRMSCKHLLHLYSLTYCLTLKQ
jgi:hypothetical protein